MTSKLAAWATAAALAFGLTWAAGTLHAQAATTAASSSGQSVFCHAYQRFGEHPTYTGLTVVHAAARHASPGTRADYTRFQRVMLGGHPLWVLRRANETVYNDCAAALGG